MGGLCILFATLLSVTVTIMGLTLGQSEFLQTDWTQQVRLAAITALLFAVIGAGDDITRIRRNQPAGLSEFIKFLLQSLAVGVVLVLYSVSGYLNTATVLPVVGYYDLGNAYYLVAYVFALFFVRCVEKTDGVDGLCTSCAFISVLGLLVLSVYFGSFEASIFPAALAGALLAFLFWNFHPAKISMGSTGSLFLAGAMFGIAQGLNWPGILWVLGLPYFIEGIFSLIQFICYLCTGKRIFSAAPLHVLLAKKGWSEFGLIYLFSGISVMGVVFTLLFIRLG
ncbi:MAG: phospho-N-acetylmuramoyl-pentapeptide-transferase [Faecalibacterium sp.]